MLPVILDVDTGVDDALALLLAVRSPELHVIGVSCVAGNVDVDQVVANTLGVLQVAGRADVPVARGAERPLLEPPRAARHVHGAHGLGAVATPASDRQAVDLPAVLALHSWLSNASEPVTVVALAPLTNIALLLRIFPEIRAKIARIVFMGGAVGTGGNASATAEFNIWHDPEAAAIMLQSDVPCLMYGLDVFYQVNVTPADTTELLASDVPAARLAGELLAGQLERTGAAHTTIGDAGAVATLLAPEMLSTATCPTEVELSTGPSRGQTIVDRRGAQAVDQVGVRSWSPRPIEVCLDVDGAGFARLFLDRMLRHG